MGLIKFILELPGKWLYTYWIFTIIIFIIYVIAIIIPIVAPAATLVNILLSISIPLFGFYMYAAILMMIIVKVKEGKRKN